MTSRPEGFQNTHRDFYWRGIRAGAGISLLLTLVLGIPLMIALDSVWWMGWTGVIGIFIGGLVAGRLAQTNEPLNGAMVALIYFSIIAIVYLVGQARNCCRIHCRGSHRTIRPSFSCGLWLKSWLGPWARSLAGFAGKRAQRGV